MTSSFSRVRERVRREISHARAREQPRLRSRRHQQKGAYRVSLTDAISDAASFPLGSFWRRQRVASPSARFFLSFFRALCLFLPSVFSVFFCSCCLSVCPCCLSFCFDPCLSFGCRRSCIFSVFHVVDVYLLLFFSFALILVCRKNNNTTHHAFLADKAPSIPGVPRARVVCALLRIVFDALRISSLPRRTRKQPLKPRPKKVHTLFAR